MIWPFRRAPDDTTERFIEHLQAQIAWLQMQMTHERQRAEISIDQRLTERGLGIVTLPPRPQTVPRDPMDEMRELIASPEFANAGQVPPGDTL